MTTFLKTALAAAAAVGALSVATASQAAVTTTGSLAAWEAAMGTWAETTSYGVSESTDFNSFTTTDGVGVSLTPDGNDRVIGSSWATWSGGYTGHVIASSANSMTFNLASGVRGFGVFAEPDSFGLFDITLNTADGGTLTQTVDGNGGAQFFGWIGSGVTSFTLTTTDSDFAAGDFFSAAGGVPEPASWAMMLVGFGGLGAVLRNSRRQRATATA